MWRGRKSLRVDEGFRAHVADVEPWGGVAGLGLGGCISSLGISRLRTMCIKAIQDQCRPFLIV